MQCIGSVVQPASKVSNCRRRACRCRRIIKRHVANCILVLSDRLFPPFHVRLLYSGVRHMGRAGGRIISNVFAVAEHHSEGHDPGFNGDRPARVLLLCHSS